GEHEVENGEPIVVKQRDDQTVEGDDPVNVGIEQEGLAASAECIDDAKAGQCGRDSCSDEPRLMMECEYECAPEGDVGSEVGEDIGEVTERSQAAICFTPDK